MSELRWHPFLSEWVVTATHRQGRTHLPPEERCPLCPTKPGGPTTEAPFADYDILVFENRFPAFRRDPPEPSVVGTGLCPVCPSEGVCEVVCYSPRHDATLASLPLLQTRKLVRVWRDRTVALGTLGEVIYVLIFENRGREVGVTLTHPHGQIYGFPFVPSVPARTLAAESVHWKRTGRALVDDWILEESADGRRIVASGPWFVVVCPFFARFPFESWIVPTAPWTSLAEVGPDGLDSLAEAVHTMSRAYEALFEGPTPLMLVVHQAPTDGVARPWTRLRVEFLPLKRAEGKLKHLASVEAGAGAFLTDTLPEDCALALRRVCSSL
jgi:UDPglucose--hexose-1-phosphate uridylyltransferase